MQQETGFTATSCRLLTIKKGLSRGTRKAEIVRAQAVEAEAAAAPEAAVEDEDVGDKDVADELAPDEVLVDVWMVEAAEPRAVSRKRGWGDPEEGVIPTGWE